MIIVIKVSQYIFMIIVIKVSQYIFIIIVIKVSQLHAMDVCIAVSVAVRLFAVAAAASSIHADLCHHEWLQPDAERRQSR
jgi:hypothetical protein